MKKRIAISAFVLLFLNILLVLFRHTDNDYLALLLASVSIIDIIIVFLLFFLPLRLLLTGKNTITQLVEDKDDVRK